MKNFAGKSNPEKKVWGVLGKQETFYSPEQFQDKGRIIPLNANPLEAWDTTRSRYIRRPQMPPMANDGQQSGVVGTAAVPDVTPTPTASETSTPTPTQTNTPSITPSSTPYILPETPALWYDATNIGSIDYISSGGTDYVSAWRSIGTYQKTVTGVTTNTMPIWSGSSQMPGSPRIVRWTKQSNTALRQFLTQRFDSTRIPQSGFTTFVVFANPGYDYNGTNTANGVGFQLFMSSGNTTGGFTAPAALNHNITIGNSSFILLTTLINGVSTNNLIPNWSATSLNSKFLYTQVSQFDNNIPYFELNQSGGTLQLPITGTTNSPISSIALGIQFTAAGAITTAANNPGIEMGEIMIFNRVLSPSEQDQVQLYLRDKWRYDEWNDPLPVPTPTPSATPAPVIPVSNLQHWYVSTDGPSVSSWTNRGLLGNAITNVDVATQPQLLTSSLGSYSGQAYEFLNQDDLFGSFNPVTYSGLTTFMVAKWLSNNTSGVYGGSFTETNELFGGNQVYTTTYGATSALSLANSNAVAGQPLIYSVSGTPGVFNAVYDIKSNVFTIPLNSPQPTPAPIEFLQIESASVSSPVVNLTIFEYIVYNRVLSASEYLQVINYLKTKYNYASW